MNTMRNSLVILANLLTNLLFLSNILYSGVHRAGMKAMLAGYIRYESNFNDLE